MQDTIRITNHLGLSLGGRYDLQTFSTKYLVSNPLWPDSGKVPFNPYNFAPRVGLAYSIGNDQPAGGARRLRPVLHPHSADLQFDHREPKRAYSATIFSSTTPTTTITRSSPNIPIPS